MNRYFKKYGHEPMTDSPVRIAQCVYALDKEAQRLIRSIERIDKKQVLEARDRLRRKNLNSWLTIFLSSIDHLEELFFRQHEDVPAAAYEMDKDGIILKTHYLNMAQL